MTDTRSKIERIRDYRAEHGVGLREAKDAVEAGRDIQRPIDSHNPPNTGGRQAFSFAQINNNWITLNSGGDITITGPDNKTVLVLGNCSKDNDQIDSLIELLQRQMNCVRGI